MQELHIKYFRVKQRLWKFHEHFRGLDMSRDSLNLWLSEHLDLQLFGEIEGSGASDILVHNALLSKYRPGVSQVFSPMSAFANDELTKYFNWISQWDRDSRTRFHSGFSLISDDFQWLSMIFNHFQWFAMSFNEFQCFSISMFSASVGSGVLQKGHFFSATILPWSSYTGAWIHPLHIIFPQHDWYLLPVFSVGIRKKQIGQSPCCDGGCLNSSSSCNSAARLLHSFLCCGRWGNLTFSIAILNHLTCRARL